MSIYNLKQLPYYVWMISTIIFLLALGVEFYSPHLNTGIFWLMNLISVSLFSYHLGLFGGIFSLLIILTLRISVDFQTFSSLTPNQLIRALFINSMAFVTSILIGYLAGKMKKNEKNIREIFDNNDITLWTRNLKTGEITVSEGNANIYGVTRQEFEQNPQIWFESIHPDDSEVLTDALQKQKRGRKTKVVYRIIRPDKQTRWIEDRGTPVFNHAGEVVRVDGVVFDVTSEKETEEVMNKMAYNDSLTGLPNRNWFQNYLEATLVSSRKNNISIGIMFIDFDNFKRVNDTLGHRVGDGLLIQMSDRLQSCIRKNDIVSRQGGDEFLVLIEDADEQEVKEIAERIINQMNHPFIVNGNEIFSTPSIGITMCPVAEEQAESLIEKADFAMYLAKESGKNNYKFYDDELNQKMKRKIMLETRLHKAIENGELAVHYQPQIDLSTSALAGAEALLRWENDLGYISPGEFIPIAEETGLIIPIGEWVIREACRHSKEFRTHGLEPFPISVNISTKQIMNPSFIPRLKEILLDEQMTPELLTLEITESALLFYDDAKDNIDELRQLGIGISIDDFGVGYSSLSMIKDIEMDELKIDQRFLNDALENKRVHSLLKTIIKIGKVLKAKVVVEGVETAEQLELLMRRGIYGQGFFYSRALPAREFEKWYWKYYRKRLKS
ncbi:EAL domain-containing protein [Virgibacillus sp. MSP4-1]|uniref:putative bifunctional diguanylate cyclase/phosphodiesterase n=1 Tax=Virgibacillus sp. MSP4-1 TaxID=2700081 RepID=UPI0003A442E4|nr:GGDEF domain-containing phosphodiesterase [Virgibacillus sp. MSP4-1]QHS21510.1 EAL domain-containing protein [Virgibacillus sp. MSP4-1]